jgi:quinol monooxygenase YgiN
MLAIPEEEPMSITVRAELCVAPDRREEFLEEATAVADATAGEAGTLRYDWYSSEDPNVFVVIEEYADPDAAISHNQNCAAFLRRIAELAEMTSAHLYGRLGPTLEEWVAQRSFAHAYRPLSIGE